MGIGSVAGAFIAGLLTTLSPCVLPILPIVLGAAASERKYGPALAAGLAASFIAIGLFVATIGYSVGLTAELVRQIAAALMIVLGAVLLLPNLQARLADAPRSGRPRTALGVIDPLLAEVIDGDPRELGYPSTGWTNRLLRRYLREFHQLAVSRKSVSRALARLRIRWKRPRHQLALRPQTWRQSKGGSNAA